VDPIYKEQDQSAVSYYRPISLNSVICKQLEHIIGGYLRQVWDENDCLYKGQHGFRPGYSCESQVITVRQDIPESLDKGVGIDVIIIDFSKAFSLVPHDWLLTKLAAMDVYSKVDTGVRELLVGHTQRVRVGGQLSKEAKVTLGVPKGSVLGPLLFLVYLMIFVRTSSGVLDYLLMTV
jgi:hypothetical protein